MRYKEQAIQPPKGKVKEEKPREMPKAGQYTPKNLGDDKKNWRGWDVE